MPGRRKIRLSPCRWRYNSIPWAVRLEDSFGQQAKDGSTEWIYGCAICMREIRTE